MKKRIWTGVCAAIVGLVAAATTAQTTSPAQSGTSSADRRITVTGCLKEAPASAPTTTTAGTTGTTGSAATSTAGTTGSTADAAGAPQKFVLTDAAPAQASAPAASTSATPPTDSPTTAGATTTAGAPAASAAQTYRLIANPTALSPHVGKKLELTGTLEPEGQAQATDSSAGSQAGGAALRVEAGKVIAASCSQ